MTEDKPKGSKDKNQLVKDTTQECVYFNLPLEIAEKSGFLKRHGFQKNTVRTLDVKGAVMNDLQIPEDLRGRVATGGKTKVLRAISKKLSYDELIKIAEKAGVELEDKEEKEE